MSLRPGPIGGGRLTKLEPCNFVEGGDPAFFVERISGEAGAFTVTKEEGDGIALAGEPESEVLFHKAAAGTDRSPGLAGDPEHLVGVDAAGGRAAFVAGARQVVAEEAAVAIGAGKQIRLGKGERDGLSVL